MHEEKQIKVKEAMIWYWVVLPREDYSLATPVKSHQTLFSLRTITCTAILE